MSDLSVGKPSATPIWRGSVREAEPLRATIKRVRRSRAHGFIALPGGQNKPWFTEPQRDLMCLLALDPSVSSFETRPVTFRFPIDAKQVDHTPDFQIERIGERAYVDIVNGPNKKQHAHPEQDKHREREETRKLIARAMEHECAARGCKYIRTSPAQIYLQPRFDNAREILRFMSVHPDEELTFRVIDAISRTGGASTLGRLEHELGGGDDVVPGLFALTLRRVLQLDLGIPLSSDTRVDLIAVPGDRRQ